MSFDAVRFAAQTRVLLCYFACSRPPVSLVVQPDGNRFMPKTALFQLFSSKIAATDDRAVCVCVTVSGVGEGDIVELIASGYANHHRPGRQLVTQYIRQIFL